MPPPPTTAGSGRAAWRKYTKSETPWQAKGDFDGDGLQDVAKVIVDKAGKRWMMGVMFGHKDGAPCNRYQISGKDLATLPIAGVITLPKGRNSLTCHHMGEQGPVTCKVEDEAFAARTTDALLTFDDVPTYSSAYLWQPDPKPAGRNRGTFEHFDVALAADFAGMAAHSQADAQNSKAGDSVSAAERKALVQEFEQAWASLQKTKNYRSSMSRTPRVARPMAAPRARLSNTPMPVTAAPPSRPVPPRSCSCAAVPRSGPVRTARPGLPCPMTTAAPGWRGFLRLAMPPSPCATKRATAAR